MIVRLQRDSECGASIPFLVVLIPTLAALIGIVIAMGRLANTGSEAQVAVDSAALAAAAYTIRVRANGGAAATESEALLKAFNSSTAAGNSVLGLDPDIQPGDMEIVKYDSFPDPGPAETIATYNGSTWDLVPGESWDDAAGVRVTKNYSVNHFLGGLFGKSNSDVTVTATAVMGGPKCLVPTLPLILTTCGDAGDPGTVCSDDACGTEYIGEQIVTTGWSGGTTELLGYFHTSQPANANDCKASVADPEGNLGEVCVGQEVWLIGGSATSCLMDIKAKCEWETCMPDGNGGCLPPAYGPPRCTSPYRWEGVIVPVVHCNELTNLTQHNKSAPVLGFASIDIWDPQWQFGPNVLSYQNNCNQVAVGVEPAAGSINCQYEGSVPGLIE